MKEKMDAVHKELDLIQAIVTRMADNSFKVKSWLIGILMAMVAFTKDEIFLNGEGSVGLVLTLFLMLPVIFFWYLDSFFLKTERLYRNLYKWVVTYRKETGDYLYDLNTFKRQVKGEETQISIPALSEVMFSQTLLGFYIIPVFFVLGLFFYNLLN